MATIARTTTRRGLLLLQRWLQLSTGSSAGGVEEEEQEEPSDDALTTLVDSTTSTTWVDNNGSSTTGSSTTGSSTSTGSNNELVDWDRVASILLGLLVGLGVLLALLAVTYLVSLMSDRFFSVSSSSPIPQLDRGPVSLKAGLFGLLLSERTQIVQHLFQPIVWRGDDHHHDGSKEEEEEEKGLEMMTYNGSDASITRTKSDQTSGKHEKAHHDSNMVRGSLSNTSLTGSCHVDAADPDNNSNNENGVVRKRTTAVDVDTTNNNPNTHWNAATPLNDAQHDRICCICLAPYQNGCRVMSTKICSHMFHYDCCLEWLQQHDECPYCRKELITATEMRRAAVEVLGPARVEEMDRARWESFPSANRLPEEYGMDRARREATFPAASLSPAEYEV